MHVSRGVVLWPDDETSDRLRSISAELLDHGVESVTSQAHHLPHVSLVVADDLVVSPTLAAIGHVPASPIPLLIEAAAVVRGAHLLLGCTPNQGLLAEQLRVHRAAAAHAEAPWPHYAPDEWLPHLTLARALDAAELAVALPLVFAHLPIRGTLVRGGIEDGATGERWTANGP